MGSDRGRRVGRRCSELFPNVGFELGASGSATSHSEVLGWPVRAADADAGAKGDRARAPEGQGEGAAVDAACGQASSNRGNQLPSRSGWGMPTLLLGEREKSGGWFGRVSAGVGGRGVPSGRVRDRRGWRRAHRRRLCPRGSRCFASHRIDRIERTPREPSNDRGLLLERGGRLVRAYVQGSLPPRTAPTQRRSGRFEGTMLDGGVPRADQRSSPRSETVRHSDRAVAAKRFRGGGEDWRGSEAERQGRWHG